MKKIVVKFGGSNLRHPEDIDRVVAVVETYKRPLVLVVSAFFDITNALVACVQAAREGAGTLSALAEGWRFRLWDLQSLCPVRFRSSLKTYLVSCANFSEPPPRTRISSTIPDNPGL